MPPIAKGLVDFKVAKKQAQEILPKSSVVRKLILAEPDYMPKSQAAEKILLYVEMREKEKRSV